MSKGTIVYIGQFIPPTGNAVAQRVLANAKLLQSIGYEVVLIGFHRDVKELKQLENTIFPTYVVPYPKTMKTWIKRCISIKEYLSVIDSLSNVKIVITCDLQSIAQAKLRKALKKRKIKYVEDTMEWIRHSRKRNLRTFIKDVDTHFRMAKQHIKTKNIICISQYLYNYYISKGCNCVKIPVLIDYEDEKWDVAEEYQPNEIKTLIYAGDAGSIGYKERLDKVVQCACNLFQTGKKFRIELIGVSKEDFVKQCPEIAGNNFFDEIVVFYGRQTHEFCLQKISKADASIIIRENSLEMQAGFPTKLSESLRLGVPPLITNIGDFDEYITDQKDCFLLKDTEEVTIENALLKLYEMDNEELKKMHENCKTSHAFDFLLYQEKMQSFLKNYKR